MKYYAKYLMNLCVPWMDETLPFFERTPKGCCSLVNTWNCKSATFIQHQHFGFLSNFMSKGHQNGHNESAATAWRQHNADWWSENKTAKNDNFSFQNATNKATEEVDDKAAGQLSSRYGARMGGSLSNTVNLI
jgi:hypothetical protein